MTSVPPRPPLHVAVVADNPETVGDLHEYLTDAGIAVDPTRALRAAADLAASVSAVVMFPDDYEETAVMANIAALRSARPRLLILLVTSAPQRLGSAAGPDGETTQPLLLPKPAFGWSILEVVRAHAAVS